MNYCWLHKENRNRLIVFCNGWGMDGQPFRPLESHEYDVLNLYDFRNLECNKELDTLLAGYGEYILIGWSMGVWAGQKIFAESSYQFTRTIAINGTLCPIDDHYGIPRELFVGTMKGWSDLARCKFYHRLCGSMEIEHCFLANQPDRSLTDQQDELAYYLDAACCMKREESMYSEVIVSDRDRIVPTAHQLEFWGKEVAVQLAGSHFPFYHFSRWDDLLNCIHNSSQYRCIP